MNDHQLAQSKKGYLLCFVVWLLSKTFFDDILMLLSGFFYLPVQGSVLLVATVLMIVYGIRIFRRSRKDFLKLVCLTCILFLPTNTMYESIRFQCLRPKMEQVAIKYAQAYKDGALRLDDTSAIDLQKGERYLSRGGYIVMYDMPEGIHVGFIKMTTLFAANVYVYANPLLCQGDHPAGIDSYDNCQKTVPVSEHWSLCYFD